MAWLNFFNTPQRKTNGYERSGKNQKQTKYIFSKWLLKFSVHDVPLFLNYILPQFYKYFNPFASSNLSKVQICPKCLCIYGFVNKFWTGRIFERLRKVCGGSNPATGQKTPKCINKISKNFRVEKAGEISRNLRFFRFFVPASKSDTHHVSTGQFRCRFCVSQFRCRAMAHFSLGETGACKWQRSSGLAEPCL